MSYPWTGFPAEHRAPPDGGGRLGIKVTTRAGVWARAGIWCQFGVSLVSVRCLFHVRFVAVYFASGDRGDACGKGMIPATKHGTCNLGLWS